MAANVFGTPITDNALTTLGQAKLANKYINDDGKDANAKHFVKKLMSQYGTGIKTGGLFYNATGGPLTLVTNHDYHGHVYEVSYPTSFQNGQWIAFLHVRGSIFVGSSAAVVYRSVNDQGDRYDYVCSWSVPFSGDNKTVHTQQRAERDAALARLEQSRIILAMRLADHQGKKYKVIEEALAFVGNVHDASRFVAPENLFEMPRGQPGETLEYQKGKRSSVLMRMLISSLTLAKNSLKVEKIGGVLGNAALFAVSMFAFLQLHQVAFRTPRLQDQNSYTGGTERSTSGSDSLSQMRHFDVFSARG